MTTLPHLQPGFKLDWFVSVRLPFDSGWSKNRMHMPKAGTYGRRLSPEARARREALAVMMRAELAQAGHPVNLRPLWLSIHVAKADHRCDALNVLDVVADAIQDATGLNDRWYSLLGLTWEIRPAEPELYVGIGQQGTQDVAACGLCGRLLPLDDFHRSKGGREDRASRCKQCASKAGRDLRARRPN